MDDLTVMYITANLMPAGWVDFQIVTLKQAFSVGNIVSVSRKPIDLGTNIVETGERCHWNIYRSMYLAATTAKTPFVAMAEDDVLYSQEHFREFRPEPDTVSYNRSRWSLFAWEKNPIYCLRQRISNCTLIAPRKLLIAALEERFAKWPDGAPNELAGEIGRPIIDRRMKVSSVKMVEWYSTCPVIQLNHVDAIDPTQQRMWKKHGQLKAFDIPFWGKSADIVKRYSA